MELYRIRFEHVKHEFYIFASNLGEILVAQKFFEDRVDYCKVIAIEKINLVFKPKYMLWLDYDVPTLYFNIENDDDNAAIEICKTLPFRCYMLNICSDFTKSFKSETLYQWKK